ARAEMGRHGDRALERAVISLGEARARAASEVLPVLRDDEQAAAGAWLMRFEEAHELIERVGERSADRHLLEDPPLAEHELLGTLADRNIDRRSDHPHATAAIVEYASSPRRHPTSETVLLAHCPIFNVVQGAPRWIERRGERLARTLAILRMQPGVEIGHGYGYIRGNAEHRLETRRPEQRIGDRVEIPQPDLGRFGRKTQLLLPLAKRALRLLAFGDIACGAEPLDDLTARIPERNGPREGPSERAIDAPHAMLELENARRPYGLPDCRQDLRLFLRIDVLVEPGAVRSIRV